jgi:hypothetical protein
MAAETNDARKPHNYRLTQGDGFEMSHGSFPEDRATIIP